ncbi:MAG: tetratricopeptide repeat protein [Phycisphaerales bacterium]
MIHPLSFRFATVLALSLSVSPALFAQHHHEHGDDHAEGHGDASAHHHEHNEHRELLDPAARKTIEVLEDRLKGQPHDTGLLSRLGTTWLTAARASAVHEHYDAAASTFEQLLAENPNSETGLLGLAYAYIGQHRFQESLEAAQRAALIEPDAIEIWALLGDSHLALGNAFEAELIYDRCLEREMTLNSLARVSLMHDYRGRHSEAVHTMEEALQAGELLDASATDRAWCYTMLGDFALAHGQLDDAQARYNQALELDPSASFAVLQLARIDLVRDDPASAEHRLRAVLSDRPLPEFWIELGRALKQQGRSEEAREWFSKAEADMSADIEHGDYGHARHLAEYWIDQDGDAHRAAELALHDLHSIRKDAGAYDTAAWTLFHAGESDQAYMLAREAVLRSPGNAQILGRAGIIAHATGHAREGRALITASRKLNPHPLDRKLREGMEAIMKEKD